MHSITEQTNTRPTLRPTQNNKKTRETQELKCQRSFQNVYPTNGICCISSDEQEIEGNFCLVIGYSEKKETDENRNSALPSLRQTRVVQRVQYYSPGGVPSKPRSDF